MEPLRERPRLLLVQQPNSSTCKGPKQTLAGGRRIYLLAKGRLVNLAAAEGHPSEVMDMSFANQYLSLCRLARDGKGMNKDVYDVPEGQDEALAGLKLRTMGVSIDQLTPAQIAYRDDYNAGT